MADELPETTSEAGSMLRLRDVQALNRAFHHLAEVQDSLLRHLQDGEARHRTTLRSRAFLTASLAGIAVALCIVAWQVHEGGLFATPEIQMGAPTLPEIQVSSPEIHLPAPEVILQGAGSELAILALTEELADLRERSAQDRARLADLTSTLLAQEEARLASMSSIGRTQPDVPTANASGSTKPETQVVNADSLAEESLLEVKAPSDLWLRTLNGLLAVDGYGHLEFRSASRIPGQAEFSNVLFLQRRKDGSPANSIRAERVEFEMHRMTRNLVIRLFDGHRSGSGARVALPPEGMRFDLTRIRADAWLQHFPELADLAPKDPAEIEKVRVALEALLSQPRSSGYWRIPVLRSLEGSVLQMVQVQRFDAQGRLLRALEADELEILLHPNGDLELQFREGAIFEGGQRRPFFEDRFRVYLPREPRDAWLTSLVPVVEV